MTSAWPIMLLLLQLCMASPFLYEPRESAALPQIRTLAQFPNMTWIENIAVRSNGQLLVTIFSSPGLYQIDPFSKHATAPKLVATFPSALGTLGIAELEEDVFAITKGNFSSTTGEIAPKSFSLWTADLRQGQTAKLAPVVDMPVAMVLNGATTVKKGSKYMLIADSVAGVVWRVNLATKKYDVAMNNSYTQPAAPYPRGWGVNGVHTEDGHLFFTNTDKGLFKVALRDDGMPAGAVEVLNTVAGQDDFAFGDEGSAYLAAGRFDAIQKFTPPAQTVALSYTNPDAQILTEGNTAVAFGRTSCDKSTLYVTTNGGWSGLVPGTYQQGGLVLAVDLGERRYS